MFKYYKFFTLENAPKCTFCGGTDTTDNGDGYYCFDCNAVFEKF